MTKSVASLQSIASQLDLLSSEDLLTLNKYLCSIVKERNTVKRMQATIGFKVGDKVEFTDSRRGVTRKCIVNKVKRVMVAVTELAGSAEPGKRWNASATILRKI
jgi:hypothetical protein